MLFKLFLPFAFGYFLSFLYRVVNVAIAPDLVQEFGLNANQMGCLLYTLRAHETRHDLVCRLLLEKKKRYTHPPYHHYGPIVYY